MPIHALRKSLGPFSAGTRVRVINDNHDGTVNIEVMVPEPDETNGYDFEDMVFDTDKSDLVELRERSENVHSTTRKKRRAFLSELFNKTQNNDPA